MTEPALRSLKMGAPEREIHLLTSRSGSAAVPLLGVVDRCIVHDPVWMHSGGAHDPRHLQELIACLRAGRYDGAVIFNVYSQNPLPAAMACFMAGITEVAAYCRENPYGLLTTWIPDEEPLYAIRHEVSRQLNLALYLGGARLNRNIELIIPEKHRKSAMEKLEVITKGEKFLLMHPGASEARRLYPPHLFAAAAQRIREELGYRVILTGTGAEAALTKAIARQCGGSALSTAGIFNVPELAAVIGQSPLLISNNSGPVHIAAGMGTPCIVLYAQTNPQHAPWMVDHCLLQFEVPEDKRSKNTIIRFAHERSFKPVDIPGPEQILASVRSLVKTDQPINT
jgi:ADP-heptose:LPS heptosyltransferase